MKLRNLLYFSILSMLATQAFGLAHITSIDLFMKKIERGNTVAYFTADWCFYCKQFEPTINTVAIKFPTISFLQVNVNQAEAIALTFSVSSLPTVLYFKDGKLVDRTRGSMSQRNFEAKVKQVFNL